MAAEIPSDKAMAAPDKGPGSPANKALAPALAAVFAAILEPFLAAVSLSEAALAALLCSAGVVMVLTTENSGAATAINGSVGTTARPFHVDLGRFHDLAASCFQHCPCSVRPIGRAE